MLGISQSTWTANGIYQAGSGQYTGENGLAAYRVEFDPAATYIPVEQAGSSGTMNNHWNQIMRSSTQEGDPNDPWSLSPLTGITDSQGRDLELELMTGAIDPDYGEPFLSNMTVQSLRDLGYTVVPEPSSLSLLLVALLLNHRRRTQERIPACRLYTSIRPEGSAVYHPRAKASHNIRTRSKDPAQQTSPHSTYKTSSALRSFD